MPPQPGYLSSANGSNIEVSCGGDPSILAFYSTVASTAWTPKRLPPPPENITEISTGFVKNKTHLQPHYYFGQGLVDESFMTEYMAVNDRTMKKIRSSDQVRPVGKESKTSGGFSNVSGASPIKWHVPQGAGSATKHMMAVKKRQDPTAWENNGRGPSEYSTSTKVAYVHPLDVVRSLSPDGSPQRTAGTDRGSTSTGWRENNVLREHPWEHPGALPWNNKEKEERDKLVMQATSGFNEQQSEETPVTDSGFVRVGRKLVLGTDRLEPHEKISTTHLAYVQGRTTPMPGLLVEVAPRLDGLPLGKSGFCKNAPTKGGLFPPVSPEGTIGEGINDDPYRTISSLSFQHPGLRYMPKGDSVVPCAGLQSSFARSVTPVDTLAIGHLDSNRRLHPTVEKILSKRDPYYYNSKVFKITDQVI